MKQLHLLRHAKSSWRDPSLADIDRPLNQRGLRSAAEMADQLAAIPEIFDNMYCSPARRAQQTLEVIAQCAPTIRCRWRTDAELYTFDSRQLLNWLQRRDDTLTSLTIVAHNPALFELANALLDSPIEKLPTAAYLGISLQIESWSQCPVKGSITQFIRPRKRPKQDKTED